MHVVLSQVFSTLQEIWITHPCHFDLIYFTTWSGKSGFYYLKNHQDSHSLIYLPYNDQRTQQCIVTSPLFHGSHHMRPQNCWPECIGWPNELLPRGAFFVDCVHKPPKIALIYVYSTNADFFKLSIRYYTIRQTCSLPTLTPIFPSELTKNIIIKTLPTLNHLCLRPLPSIPRATRLVRIVYRCYNTHHPLPSTRRLNNNTCATCKESSERLFVFYLSPPSSPPRSLH